MMTETRLKALVVVATLGSFVDFAIARFNADGTLDTIFSPGGTDGNGKLVISKQPIARQVRRTDQRVALVADEDLGVKVV